MKVLQGFLLGLLCLAVTPVAMADGLQIGGFGSLSTYRGDETLVAVRPGERVKNSSRDGEWRWDGDSVLGLQLRWEAHEQIELVWQVQARDDLVSRYRPRNEWAYVAWHPTADWTLRLGRQPLPVYLHSETTRVGYAHTAVRPMSAVYGLNGSEPIDGLNLSWSRDVLGGNLSLDLGSGRNEVTLPRGRIDTRSSTTGALRWQRDGLSLRLGLAAFRFDLLDAALDAQLAALSQTGSPCSNCASVLQQRASTRNVEGGLLNLGLVWERGNWTLTAEAMRRSGNSVFLPKTTAWYAQLAHRLGTFTPYAAIGTSRFDEPALGLQAAPGTPTSVVAGLAQLDRSLQRPFGRRIMLAGVRWDLHDQAALKLQVERWTATQDSRTPRNGEIVLLADTSAWNGRASLLTLSLDFVF